MIVNLFESISTYPFIMDKNRQTTTIDCQRIDSNVTESPDRQTARKKNLQCKNNIPNNRSVWTKKKELMKRRK